MRRIKGFLIDLDGVIYNDSQLIAGAKETIADLKHRKIPFRFITNTTMRCRRSLQQKLHSFGIEVDETSIFSAAYAAAEFIRRSGKIRCHLLLTEDAQSDYVGIEKVNEGDVDWVVVGDLGPAVTYDKLNRAFRKLRAGAKLIALQKNRYWLSDDGYTLDAGAFVALLEYAAEQESVLIGKPSALFYQTALDDLSLNPGQVVMIGDDIESDIGGAQALGMRTILVRTGKFNQQVLAKSAYTPWKIFNSIADLPDLLNSLEEH